MKDAATRDRWGDYLVAFLFLLLVFIILLLI